MTRPRLVDGLYLTDAIVVLAYLVNVRVGSPYLFPTHLLDLDGEANLPTWYASAKLLALGLLLALFALRSQARPRSLFSLFPAILAIAMSLDEVAGIHEWVGRRSDVLLAGGDRTASFLPVTGIWMLVLAPVVLTAIGVAYRGLRQCLGAAPRARRLFIVGCVILLAGALGAEVVANFVVPGTWPAALQVALEEGAELVGATTMLWGALELFAAHGLVFVPEPGERPAAGTARGFGE